MIKNLLLLLVVLGISLNVQAAELEILDRAVTTAIEDQMPVDHIGSYPADYGKLYYFTRVVGASLPTEITHVWMFEDQDMARVTLPVQSPDWRTYSSKRFLPQWAGEWKILVLDAQGQQLAEDSFVLE